MKKFYLFLVAMLAMVQMNAATPDDAASTSDAPVAVAADLDENSESAYEHPFMDESKKTKHWSLTTSGFYLGLGVKHNYGIINNSFEVGLLNIAAVKYNSLHGQNLSLGVGIHHRSYSMKRPHMLVRDNNNIVIESTYPSSDDIKKRSSNLNQWTVQFPLMFSQKIYKKLDITIGGILNWNTFARVDNHYQLNKTDYDTHFKGLKQNKVNIDVMGALCWNETGLYCRYTPGKFFKNGYGPEIKNTWTLGLVIGL